MKRVLLTCATLLFAIVAQAQFFGFPQTERRIKLYSEPIVGLNDLFVGDEGSPDTRNDTIPQRLL